MAASAASRKPPSGLDSSDAANGCGAGGQTINTILLNANLGDLFFLNNEPLHSRISWEE
jgi:hypothetical protein